MSFIPKKIDPAFLSGNCRSAKLKRVVFSMSLFALAFAFVLNAAFVTVLAQKTDNVKQGEDDILTGIRTAKTLIENEEWAKARGGLEALIIKYPQNKYLDIVYYWLAYTQFQQKNYPEAEQTIARLQSEFPNSEWNSEAKNLLAEINSKKGRVSVPTAQEISGDDETEAFNIQSLLESDHPKGAARIDELFGAGSNASVNLRESVLLILADDKSDWATDKLIWVLKTEKEEVLLKQALIGLADRDVRKTAPVVRDFIKQNDNEEFTDAAFYALSGRNGENSFADLVYFAKNAANVEVRRKSIIWLGEKATAAAVRELKSLYGSLTEKELKEQVQISLNEMETTESFKALMDLIDGETDKDLVEHGLELLEQKTDPTILRYLERKKQKEN
ncbi:MAG: tetratricopeptide repeat protein [Pyrinomonadaceae bacterium]|nr:tetratricopeptide repeat protein [Pyrinomonadaceae bacterium]